MSANRRSADRQEEGEVGARELLVALGGVVALTEPELIRLWKSSRLTFVQLRVLRTLRDRAASPGELAAAVGVSTASMARTLARLEERGLIARSIDPRDRRRIEVTLQPEGSRVLSASWMWRGTAFERAAKGLDADARRRLVEALRGFTEAVQRELLAEEAAGAPVRDAALDPGEAATSAKPAPVGAGVLQRRGRQ
jgi:DNA-binding MarR family transcriptional regulator